MGSQKKSCYRKKNIIFVFYVEYLLIRYETEKKEDDIPQEHKLILTERYLKMKQNSGKGESWNSVKKKLLEKYAV